MANVTYNEGTSYNEHVDEQNGTSTIDSLNEPNKKQCVFEKTYTNSNLSIFLRYINKLPPSVMVSCWIKFMDLLL